MNIRSILSLVLICSLITACAKQWTKPGATPEQVNADIRLCEGLATERYPVELVSTDTSSREGYKGNCPSAEHQINCPSSGEIGGLHQYDRNQEYRQQATSECMQSKGYSR